MVFSGGELSRKALLGMFWEDAGAHESLGSSPCSFPRPWMSLPLSLGFLLLVGCTIIPKRKSVLSLISVAKCAGGGRRDLQTFQGPCLEGLERQRGSDGLADSRCPPGLEASSNQNPGPSASKASMPEEHKISKYLSPNSRKNPAGKGWEARDSWPGRKKNARNIKNFCLELQNFL